MRCAKKKRCPWPERGTPGFEAHCIPTPIRGRQAGWRRDGQPEKQPGMNVDANGGPVGGPAGRNWRWQRPRWERGGGEGGQGAPLSHTMPKGGGARGKHRGPGDGMGSEKTGWGDSFPLKNRGIAWRPLGHATEHPTLMRGGGHSPNFSQDQKTATKTEGEKRCSPPSQQTQRGHQRAHPFSNKALW